MAINEKRGGVMGADGKEAHTATQTLEHLCRACWKWKCSDGNCVGLKMTAKSLPNLLVLPGSLRPPLFRFQVADAFSFSLNFLSLPTLTHLLGAPDFI